MSHSFLKKSFLPRSPVTTKTDRDTSWNQEAAWYQKLVGNKGHYYHRHIVLPGVLRLLQVQPSDTVLDLGCGQGIFAYALPPVKAYFGIDAAPNLIKFARQNIHKQGYEFCLADLTQPFVGQHTQHAFQKAVMILSLQNMKDLLQPLQTAAQLLVTNGQLVIVLNHPCFRIPRQSAWEVNEKSKQQFRAIYRYLSSMEIPIEMHPSNGPASVTWSFHHPLQDYFQALQQAGFAVVNVEEWASDRESVGKAAKMENRSRAEIPLFLTLVARKII